MPTSPHHRFRQAWASLAGGRRTPALWCVAGLMAGAALAERCVTGEERTYLDLMLERGGQAAERAVLDGFLARHGMGEAARRDEVSQAPDLMGAEEWQCIILAAEMECLAHDMAALDEGRLPGLSASGNLRAPAVARLVRSAVKLLDVEAPLGVERPVSLREGATPHEQLLSPGSMCLADLLALREELSGELDEGCLSVGWAGYDHGTPEADVRRDLERYCQATYGRALEDVALQPATVRLLGEAEECLGVLVALGWACSLRCTPQGGCELRTHKAVGAHVAHRIMRLASRKDAAGLSGHAATQVAALLASDVQTELAAYPALEADWSMLTMMELQEVVDELNAASAAVARLA